MTEKKSDYIPREVVKQALHATRPWEAAAYYGYAWPEGKQRGEVRIPCPFNAACQESSYGELAVNTDKPHSPIYCHSCHTKGDLLVLMWGMKKRTPPPAEGLRGDNYKEIRDDLLVIRGIREDTRAATKQTVAPPTKAPRPTEVPQRNTPLAKSENEAARALVNLDEQGTLDESAMTPAAARFRAARPWMTDELLRKWRVTYLPKSVKSILKGRWIYPVSNVRGEILWWQGRDPEYEQKFHKWDAADRPEKGKPIKHKLPANVHKGIEFFGQQASRLAEPGYREFIAQHGIILVEGFHDVMRFDAAGAVALGMMGKVVTDNQAALAWKFARAHGGNRVTVMCDNNSEGVEGAERSLAKLSLHGPVLNAWSPESFEGRFANLEPEHLSDEDIQLVLASLTNRWCYES